PTVRLFQPEGLPGSSQGSVIQSGNRSGMQTQPHAQYHVATGLLREQAVAVSENAGVPPLPAQGSGASVQRLQAVEQVTQLDAVGTDILHGGSAHGARYQ